MTVIRVDAIGAMPDPVVNRQRFIRKFSEAYSSIAKIEIVCGDEGTGRLVQVVKKHGWTGLPGDGRILLVHRGRATLASCLFDDYHQEKVYLERTVEFFRRKAGLRMEKPRRFGARRECVAAGVEAVRRNRADLRRLLGRTHRSAAVPCL